MHAAHSYTVEAYTRHGTHIDIRTNDQDTAWNALEAWSRDAYQSGIRTYCRLSIDGAPLVSSVIATRTIEIIPSKLWDAETRALDPRRAH